MNKNDVMRTLEELGSDACRKTYLRNGAEEPVFGVRYGDMYKLVKKIGTDHALADDLWATGNHDARICAAMIADPGQTKVGMLDKWVKSATNQFTCDAVAGLASKTKHARRCMEKWMASKNEWTAATGWHLLATLCALRPEGGAGPANLTDDELADYLEHIEANIQGAQNRVRHHMNGALISIAACSAALQKQAIAAAKRIGKVEVDHGATACETPDAVKYIQKMADHKKKRAAKKTSEKTTKKKATKKPARS